jgi:AcrR family transcriptional regulator
MNSKNSSKERILSSALVLYSKYGIRSITMDDLCRELGISKKTLYLIVDDKKDLINKVVEYEIEVQRNSMKDMFSSNLNAIDELIHVNKHIHTIQGNHSPTFYFDLKKTYPIIYGDWIKYKRERMYKMILQNLNKGVSEGLYREDIDAVVISKLHMARTEMMHSSDIIDEDERSAKHFIDEIFKYHIHGICNEKGISYFYEQIKEYATI